MVTWANALSPVIIYDDLFKTGNDEIIETGDNSRPGLLKEGDYEFLAGSMHLIKLAGGATETQSFSFKSEKSYISLVFAFKSSSRFISRHNNKVFAEVQSNQAGIVFINDQVFENHLATEPGGELYVLNMTTEYFERFLSAENPLYDTFCQTLKENLPVLLNEKAIDITAKIKAPLFDIFQCGHKGYYKYLYVRSRLIELLMLLFQEYEMTFNKLPEICTSDSNLEKMYEVKDIIDSNLTRSCTLLDLAQQVGTNECYLKKHFKQVFGTTVFGYAHTQRMLRSREMLLNEDRKIAEVAKLSGYKHASHFTTAFKKYFGYLPHQIKILLLSLFHSSELPYSIEMLYCIPV